MSSKTIQAGSDGVDIYFNRSKTVDNLTVLLPYLWSTLCLVSVGGSSAFSEGSSSFSSMANLVKP